LRHFLFLSPSLLLSSSLLFFHSSPHKHYLLVLFTAQKYPHNSLFQLLRERIYVPWERSGTRESGTREFAAWFCRMLSSWYEWMKKNSTSQSLLILSSGRTIWNLFAKANKSNNIENLFIQWKRCKKKSLIECKY
jgi:hypothetical protein